MTYFRWLYIGAFLLLTHAAGIAQVVIHFDEATLQQVYDGTPRVVTAQTDPGGLPVTITYDGATQPPIEHGIYEVIATVDDGIHFAARTNLLTVLRAPASISWNLPADAVATSSVPLEATSTSGRPVFFNVMDGPGLIHAHHLTFTGAGDVVVSACCDGSFNWLPTCSVRTVQVSRATGSITLINLQQTYTGQALHPQALTIPAGLAVDFDYPELGHAPVHAGTYSVHAGFADSRWEAVATNLFEILRAPQSIDRRIIQFQDVQATTALFSAASSGLPVTYELIDGPAVLQQVGGQWQMTYTATGRVTYATHQAGNANWLPFVQTNHFYVFENPHPVTLTNLIQTFNGSPRPVQVLFPPGSPLTENDLLITYNGHPSPPVNVGLYEVLAVITNGPAGGGVGMLRIERAPDTITFHPPGTMVFGSTTTLHAVSASGETCSFVTTDASIVQIQGSELHAVDVGLVIVSATSPGNANYLPARKDRLLRINKAGGQVVFDPLSLEQIYSGSGLTVEVTTLPPGLSTVATYAGQTNLPVNAGSYPVLVQIVDSQYEGVGTNTLVITRAPVQITFPTPIEPTPTTNAAHLMAFASSFAPISYEVVSGPGFILPGGTLLPFNHLLYFMAGDTSVLVRASAPQTANWLAGAVTTAFHAVKSPIPITVSPLLQGFDGTPRSVTASSGAVGTPIDLLYNGSPMPPIAVGLHPVVASLENARFRASVTNTLRIIEKPEVSQMATPEGLRFDWFAESLLYYTLQMSTNLMNAAAWQNVPPHIRIPGNDLDQHVILSEFDPDHAVYRIIMHDGGN